MKILHLTLKKKWFDMILSGEKTEEYREMKAYWYRRLVYYSEPPMYIFNDFVMVCFTNGYAKDAPTMTVECLGIEVNSGKTEWGANYSQHYYVIKLGKIISTNNIQPLPSPPNKE